MVYLGKPSSGCLNCKQRKIKCDEVRPTCTQCTKSKRTCPGYAQPLDLVLRDQTQITLDKIEGKKLQRGKAYENRKPSQTATKYIKAGQSRGYTEKTFLSSLLLPHLSPSSKEDVAVSLFFNNIVSVPRHPESVRGFLDCVLPLYTATRDGSLLHQAVASVSLAIAGGSPVKVQERLLSRHKFGNALVSAHTALNDPQESVKDETLMAVLILGLYERITSVAEASIMSKFHDAGAIALVKHRGKKLNNSSKIAVTLFNAVHSQIIEHALDQPASIDSSVADCLALAVGVPQTAASRLNLVCTELVDLRTKAKSILGESGLQERIPHLLMDAFNINQQLINWAQSVPPEWNKVPARGFEVPPNVARERFMYQERVDVYLDVFVVQVWNFYRASRIKVLTIMVECFATLGIPSHGPLERKKQEVLKDLQDLVDDICGSIPYHLGTKMVPGILDDPSVEYPYINAKVSKEHRQAIAASGGWSLIEPYNGPLKAAMEAPCTRKGQREWLNMQLTRLAELYCIGPTVALIKQSIRQVSPGLPSPALTPEMVDARYCIVTDNRKYQDLM